MHWLRILLIVAITLAWISFPSVLSWGVCKTAKETGETLKCYQCASPGECENPNDYITCDDIAVNWTLTQLQNYFPDSKILIEPSERYMCFAASATRLDGKEYETRGCMYYKNALDEKPFLKYWFDFRYFLRYLRGYRWETYARYINKRIITGSSKKERHWEQHNRTYWNATHFIKSNCFQCADSYCNQEVSPYGGRKRFQRQFRANNHWDCFKFETRNEAEFQRICRKRWIWGPCSEKWKWPKDTYYKVFEYTKYIAGFIMEEQIFTQ